MKLKLLAALILSTATLTVSVNALENCPKGCKCKEDHLTEVGQIYVVNCGDQELLQVPDLLQPLSKVTLPIYLILKDNEISSVSSADFPPGLNIFSLDLSQNADLQISDDTFLNLASTLKKLTLDAIGLTFHKPLKMLANLKNLEEVSVSHNNKMGYVKNAVEVVETVLFESEWPVVKSLKKLHMSHCGIRSMSAATIDSLIALRELDLSNNRLTSVPSVVKHLKELSKLSLFSCNIGTLEDYVFLGLSKLEVIELTANTMKTIERNAFTGLEKSLKKLHIERCHLQQIPSEAVRDLTVLEYLDLSRNSFTKAPASSFQGKYCLKELLVSAVGLEFEPLTFVGQKNCVTDLTIKQMQLKVVPREALVQLDKLERLSLEHNDITELPANAFSGIRARVINLANNPLTKIDASTFLGLPQHLDINLRRTKMASIDFLLGYSPDVIATVNLDYAELVCQCSMKSSLNATLNIHIYGSCRIGSQEAPLSSSRLEGMLDKICLEEEAGNSGDIGKVHFSLYISLLSLCIWKICQTQG